MGGIGHTSCLYTDQDNQPARVSYFGQKMKTARILINTPASQGGIGDLYNFQTRTFPDSGLWFLGW
ncbi:bifunctional acetaldehyde-CoA/alcohol dehydrogenase [Escherichia coli]|nr:bifunctional acetaldehyde-CoA/alcohol dehydrogenase [Escherichia coli]